MKNKYFILMITVLLSLTASAAKKQGTVSLKLTDTGGSSSHISAVATFDDATHIAMLGNGYNACITQYEEGSITIPGTCEFEGATYTVEVGPMAFRFCNWITAVNVGEGVKKIGAYAFVGCASVTSVRLPSTLQSIGSGAFCELASLKTMTCNASTSPQWEWNDVFTSIGTQASMKQLAEQRTLYVPEGNYTNYRYYQFDGTSTDAHELVGWQHAFKHIYGFSTEPVSIGSAEELMAFRDAVNSGTAYKNSIDPYSVILTADIDLSSVSNWTPIGSEDHPFGGNFNGNGHVISGLKSTKEIINCGLFGVTNGASIYHFHLLNPEISMAAWAGSVVGKSNDTRISDVMVTSNASGSNYTVQALMVAGGIVGASAASTTIERCLFRGRIKGYDGAGGIVGFGLHGLTITDCSADNYIAGDKDSSSKVAGGIVSVTSQATITRCLARNEFANVSTKGAIVGELYNNESSTTLTSDISACAYLKSTTSLNLVGSRGSKTDYTETLANSSYDEAASMIGNATSTTLGDSWHYFRTEDFFYDYPMPETLADMYLWHMKYETDANGLVYRPVEISTGYLAYQVIGYTGTAETVTIPDSIKGLSVTAVAAEVFKGNTTIKTITIGKHIMLIEDRAFYGSAIETLTFAGNNLVSIGRSAFEDCDSLQQVELPNSVRTLGARAFCGCDNLTSFGISNELAEHDGNFLAYCHKLTHLYIRGDIPKNYNNFYCLDNVLIHQVEFMGRSTTYIVACAAGKTGNYTLPTQIDETTATYNRINVMGECFEGCSGLTGITFPAGKTYWVGPRAFSGATNLRYIDMSSVAGIREGESDTPVQYNVDRQNVDDPFYGTSNSTIIYLPTGHNAEADEPNVVSGGTAHRLLLTDGWDFTPPVDVTATNGVTYDRTFTATLTEMTRPTGNKITVIDEETGQTKEIDELVVTGYAYPPTGYSVCLPYTLTITSDSIKVYEPTSITTPTGGSGERLNVFFTEVTDKTMEPYKPYYITVFGDREYDMNTTDTTYIPRQPAMTPWLSENIEFKGTTTVISNADLSADNSKPAYILQDDGNWHRVAADTEEAYVPTFRAYFQATEGNSVLQLTTLFDIQGDVNQDGQVTISDVSFMIDVILGVQTNYESLVADVNKDGNFNISDVTTLIGYLLSGTWN